MRARWLDLVDPDPEELLTAVGLPLDPEAVEALTARPVGHAHPRPVLEGHGRYVHGVVLVPEPRPADDRVDLHEVGVVAAPGLLVTVRRTLDGRAWSAEALRAAAAAGASAGELIHRLLDDAADAFLAAVDAVYDEIDELEDNLDRWDGERVRHRITDLRHQLLHVRRAVTATRGAVRRVIDGRVEVGGAELFPSSLESALADTYETLVRATEELDVARELLASVRDHHQSKVAAGQSEVGKKLTVVASLLLLPTLIVGVYGQNFTHLPELDWRYGYAFSWGLIAVTTVLQLAFYRWRRWI